MIFLLFLACLLLLMLLFAVGCRVIFGILRVAVLSLVLSGWATAQDQLKFPGEVRQWFRNPDGSCVQCSLAMCGVWQNVPAASTLLWDTEYGPRVRGGSGPSRVEQYCDQRKIAAYNITGSSTWEWMDWAAKTGRFAAIGAAPVHFQTLCWFDPATKQWWVCNNNSPEKFDPYTPEQFRRLHLSSGQWIVILKAPPPPAYPVFDPWWEQ